MERVKGIEPSSSAWKAVALPLSYTRKRLRSAFVLDFRPLYLEILSRLVQLGSPQDPRILRARHDPRNACVSPFMHHPTIQFEAAIMRRLPASFLRPLGYVLGPAKFFVKVARGP
jgi:hypothetical protein